MLQKDNPQENVQALRSVDKSIPPNSVPCVAPDEIYHVDTHPDPDTQKDIVLWDDILQAFNNAVQVRHKTKVVPFLKGKDFAILQPRRIAAMPNTVLDVIVETSTIVRRFASPQHRQLEPTPPMPPLQSYDTSMSAGIASSQIVPPAPSSSISPRAPSTVNSTARRDVVHGFGVMTTDNNSHTKKPFAFSSARGPQVQLNDQTAVAVKDLPAPQSVCSDRSQSRGPQSSTADTSVKKDLVQTSISASLGDKLAQVALGDMYRDGKEVAQDYEAAMDWYLKAAEQGDAAGQHRIGRLYHLGLGVDWDCVRAMSWYLKSAGQGYVRAQVNIGTLYKTGAGVPKDYAQAMVWFLKAADQGYAIAQYHIGLIYDFGRGVPRDFAKAAEWYLKAAERGHATSQTNISIFYKHGRGLPKDATKSDEWLQKSLANERKPDDEWD